MEKAERTQVHQMIKELFNSVNSITVDKDGKKFIKCMKQNKKSMYTIDRMLNSIKTCQTSVFFFSFR